MDSEPEYVVLIRVPIPRGDVKDPDFVKWNAAKDDELWKIVSGVAKPATIDWKELEKRFGASQDWLVQQVARLHYRFDSRVRETIAAAKTAPPEVQPPLPASDSGTPMARTGSGQGQPGRPRAPSQLSIRNTAIRNDGSLPTTPRGGTGPSSTFAATPRLQASRGPSGGTPAQVGGPGSAAGSLRLRTGVQSSKPRFSPLNDAGPSSPTPQTASPTSDHTSGSDDSPVPAQSRVIHPPYFQSNTGNLDDAGMEEDEPQAAFLPYESNPPSEKDDASEGSGERYSDPSATLRGEPHVFAANATRRLQNVTDTTQVSGKGKGKERERLRHRSGRSDSSGGSDHMRHIKHHRTPVNPLSPLRTAELKGRAVSRDVSDGAPSMGSSFDDLDVPGSITQSALEEAMASKMQGGSFTSTISMLKSRYLTGPQ